MANNDTPTGAKMEIDYDGSAWWVNGAAYESLADAEAAVAHFSRPVTPPAKITPRESCRDCGAPGPCDDRGLGINCGCATE